MISPQAHSRVRRLPRHAWSRSLATALGGGILIDAAITRGGIDPADQPRGGTWILLAPR
jgi:hypothetical protein